MMPIDFNKVSLIAIDPGLRGCGLAVFKSGILYRAEYVRNHDEKNRGPVAHMVMAECVAHAAQDCVGYDTTPTHITVEFPQIYSGPQKAIDPNDLLDVAGVASACMATVAAWLSIHDADCRWTLPAGWKGNIKKEIMTNRISASLTPAERGLIVSAGAKDHNTLDAVGIGLWQLGRLNQRKVFS